MAHPLGAALAEAGDLLLPVSCAGCGRPGGTLCAACRRAILPAVTARTLDGGPQVVSALRYEGVAAAVVRAFKETGRTGLALALAPAMRAALRAGAERAGEEVLAVPIPATAASLGRRGYRPVEVLLHRAGVRPARALRWTRAADDQRALGRAERAANLAGALVAARPLTGQAVVVVDDVVTTGATIAEASLALADAGARVLCAVTLAATPLRRPAPRTGRESPANSS